jgi:hypothetical protein
MRDCILWIIAGAICLVGCQNADVPLHPRDPDTSLRFSERAGQVGLNFAYENSSESEMSTILESLGGGVGIFDFDQDGSLDVVFPGGGIIRTNEITGRANGLFRQVASRRFMRCDEQAGIESVASYSHGVAIHDLDDDGFSDVLLTGYGALTLFMNQGDGCFIETTAIAGLTDNEWSSSAAFGDITGDGVVDLYVAHYANWSLANHPVCLTADKKLQEICPPRSFAGVEDDLYVGLGDGRFIQRALPQDTPCKGLGVIIADLDLDADLDIYVANDTDPNFLYSNNGGELLEIGWKSGTAVGFDGAVNGSMGVDCGDLNLDGKPDLWVTNYEQESICLYANLGEMFFQELSSGFGLESLSTATVGWGTVLADFDNDGDEDAFVGNGHVIKYPSGSSVLQKPWLLINDNGLRFNSMKAEDGSYLERAHSARGVAAGDIDQDGDVDLIISSNDSPVAMLFNESDPSGRAWMSMRLIGRSFSRTPTGVVVVVQTDSGRKILRQLKNGGSFASASSGILHFGLDQTERILRADIVWPGGESQTLNNVPIGRTLTVIQGREYQEAP